MHLCMLQVWDGCRPGESTCPLNLHNPCMFTQIDIVPRLAFNSVAHKNTVSQTYTIGVRHKIYNNKSLPNRHWKAPTILQAALNSGWSAICYLKHLAKQKRLQPKHLKGLIAHVAHKFSAVWLKQTITVRLARQHTENTLIQFETQAYLPKCKWLNW